MLIVLKCVLRQVTWLVCLTTSGLTQTTFFEAGVAAAQSFESGMHWEMVYAHYEVVICGSGSGAVRSGWGVDGATASSGV